MDIFLWTLQIVLAVLFAGSGAAKATMGRQRLIDSGQTGIQVWPMPAVRFAAVCELLAAAGLVLPWALDVAPVLTPLAAAGLCLVMVLAAYSHASLREPWPVVLNVVLFGLALTVALERLSSR